MTSSEKDKQILDDKTLFVSDGEKEVLYSRMFKLSPDDPYPYLQWALRLLKRGQYQKAKQQFNRSIKISPDDNILYNNWMEALYFGRYFNDAIVLITMYPQKLPYPGNIQNTLGMCFLHLSHDDQAIECFQKSIEMKNSELPYINWALALVLKGQKEEALKICQNQHKANFAIGIYKREIELYQEELSKEINEEYQDQINEKIEALEFILDWMLKPITTET